MSNEQQGTDAWDLPLFEDRVWEDGAALSGTFQVTSEPLYAAVSQDNGLTQLQSWVPIKTERGIALMVHPREVASWSSPADALAPPPPKSAAQAQDQAVGGCCGCLCVLAALLVGSALIYAAA